MNIDEQIRMMEEDSEGATKGSPIEVAHIVGIKHPQKIYGWLRAGKLQWERCECGRRVVSIAAVKELLEPQVPEEEEVARRSLDTEERDGGSA